MNILTLNRGWRKCFSGWIDTSKGVTAHRASGRRQAGAPEETAGEARPDLLEELRPAATSDSALIWEPLGVKGGERESSLSNFGIKRRIYLPSQLSICLQRRAADLPSVVLPPGWRRDLHLWRSLSNNQQNKKKATIMEVCMKKNTYFIITDLLKYNCCRYEHNYSSTTSTWWLATCTRWQEQTILEGIKKEKSPLK